MKTNRSNKGFTLVEILIVVVILGILAAIVIPQFSQASSEARVSSIKSNLQMVRSQIELYKIQHNEALPGAGTLDFVDALTLQSDIDGATGTDYGPYMQKFPVNAILDVGSVIGEIVYGTTAPAVTADMGWNFNSTTGVFTALNAAALPGDEDW
ncbi:MAG: prepilin-type N-terminal cleavage/methylation domain-containing protein [Planctomycetes bacterium]|nr:prepilin-type N-terminal cleavage/methylation domain-containing protein [Planctomycetota bacterium]